MKKCAAKFDVSPAVLMERVKQQQEEHELRLVAGLIPVPRAKRKKQRRVNVVAATSTGRPEVPVRYSCPHIDSSNKSCFHPLFVCGGTEHTSLHKDNDSSTRVHFFVAALTFVRSELQCPGCRSADGSGFVRVAAGAERPHRVGVRRGSGWRVRVGQCIQCAHVTQSAQTHEAKNQVRSPLCLFDFCCAPV